MSKRQHRHSIVGRVLSGLRNYWRILTSMRTALFLLFFIAAAAIPGALMPQRSLNESKVLEYLAAYPTWGKYADKLQLFDVFSSWWFTAIYVLLFVSLVGCVVPRLAEHTRQMRADLVKAPTNLQRLPHYSRVRTSATPDEILSAATRLLKGWRLQTSDQVHSPRVAGSRELSAERGYAREFGNISFHLGLVGILISVALGKFYYYEGQVIIPATAQSPAFCNTTPAAFDSLRAGQLVDGTSLNQFCVKVKNFDADYLSSGQAQMFRSDIAYTTTAQTYSPDWDTTTLVVNNPLRINGDRVYLQGHGFIPRFTVIFPDGQERSDAVQFKPEDPQNFLSSGVLRFDPPAGLYPDIRQRRTQQIAIEGLFAPTALFQGKLLTSAFPQARDPAVAIDVYRGDAGLDSGRAQSIFALDRTLITTGLLTKQARVNLRPGESTTLDDGTVVRFDGADEFVNLQISHDPAQIWVGVSAVVMMAGLLVSLLVRRRRIFLRIESENGHRVVHLAGIAKTDQAGWGKEFTNFTHDIARRLARADGVRE